MPRQSNSMSTEAIALKSASSVDSMCVPERLRLSTAQLVDEMPKVPSASTAESMVMPDRIVVVGDENRPVIPSLPLEVELERRTMENIAQKTVLDAPPDKLTVANSKASSRSKKNISNTSNVLDNPRSVAIRRLPRTFAEDDEDLKLREEVFLLREEVQNYYTRIEALEDRMKVCERTGRCLSVLVVLLGFVIIRLKFQST